MFIFIGGVNVEEEKLFVFKNGLCGINVECKVVVVVVVFRVIFVDLGFV